MSGRWEGNGVQNLPHNPLPRRQGFAGPMSPSNGFIPRPASALITPGLQPGIRGERNGSAHYSSKLSKKDSVSSPRKSLSEGGLTPHRHTTPDAAAATRAHSTALRGPPTQCASSRTQPAAPGTVQRGFTSGCWGFQGSWPPVLGACSSTGCSPAHTKPTPVCQSAACMSSVPVTQARKPSQPPPPPAEPQKGGGRLLPAF